jgi:hypothetical protein
MLALHGFETWGLEVSHKAVDTANTNVEARLASPSEDNFAEGQAPPKPASATVILGDFFERDWESQICPEFEGFDVIYDYTASCASPLTTLKVDEN